MFWVYVSDADAKLLLQHGADPFAVDNEGNLPLVEPAVVARAAHRRKALLSVVAKTAPEAEQRRRAM